jgi:hypothetical protein
VSLKFFVPFFTTGCILVCSTHHLPLRFGTQVPNMMCITMVQKLKVAKFPNFAPKVVKVYCPCWAQDKKNFSFHFKRYNLTICEVNFFETFCTCSLNSLGQDITVKITIFFKFFFLHLGFLS